MVKQCVVCNRKYSLEDNCTFNRFPIKGCIVRKKWIRFVQKHGVNKDWVLWPKNRFNDTICSLHFSSEDFYEYHTGIFTLKQMACPTILDNKVVEKRHVQEDAKSSTSSTPEDEAMELVQSTSQEQNDPPNDMRSEEETAEKLCNTSTGDTAKKVKSSVRSVKRVKQCVVCNIKFSPKDNVCTFHKFPKEGLIMRDKWIRFVRRHVKSDWKPSIDNQFETICSLHFSLKDFYRDHVGNPLLRQLAQPKIFKYEYVKKTSVQIAAKRPNSPNPQRAVMELERSNSPEELDAPSEKRSEVLLYESPACTSTEDTENITMNELANASSDAAEGSSVALIQQPKVTQELSNLYQLQQQQVKDLEDSLSLDENDLEQLKNLKNNLSVLQERILNWALNVVQEKFEISAEQDAEVSKFVQSDYLLLKEDNKMLRAAVAARDKSLALLKGRMKYELDFCGREANKMKTKLKGLEEENSEVRRQLRKKNSDLQCQCVSLIREKKRADNRLITAQISNTNLSKQVKECTNENNYLKKQLSECLRSAAILEGKYSNNQNTVKITDQELVVVKRPPNKRARQKQHMDVKIKSLQELEKGCPLVTKIKRRRATKKNPTMIQASGDNSSANIEVVVSSKSDWLPTNSAASYDPQLDPDGEHRALEEAEIMFVVESDEEEPEDEALVEEFNAASGDEA